MKKAIFLDRDGTINLDPGYISEPDDFNLFPDVGMSLRRLKEAGYLIVLITNQSGIARELITVEQLESIHNKLQLLLKSDNVQLDAIYYCPHHPDFPDKDGISNCNCRKPEPGLIIQAVKELGIDIEQSYMIGDKISDINLAFNSGVKPILIGSPLPGVENDLPVFDKLACAVDWILQ